MPGAYAHLTMVLDNTDIDSLSACGIPDSLAYQLSENSRYAELGAISPDMPYLAHFGRSEISNRWADRMHHARTGARLRAGVDAVRGLSGDPAQPKALAWLMGFAAHVAFDVTMHPVVNAKVGGAYGPATKAEHQKCEMHQDVHLITERHGLTDPAKADIVSTGLAMLFHPEDDDRLDPVVTSVWRHMLDSSGDTEAMGSVPDIDGWFDGFTDVMGLIEGAGALVAIGRHVVPNAMYPMRDTVERSYIDGLTTPAGSMNYLDIYKKAGGHVRDLWRDIHVAAMLDQRAALERVGAWNLDTGMDDENNQSVFWG